ncbi:ABC transporter substrate-binding protein [Massilia sp. TS11]|uniref:substrate-binding periplasmic protein n=1 Tax=Massilia sp. TS11 TaxID=2908003 RepID=UPI001EDACFAD|nr:transporter substrate-binding domain-containing protein [Massilia sp. TS11]MCG2584221.1 transporter substrate-binding domain-containing protein [Massilia sp. TS11]
MRFFRLSVALLFASSLLTLPAAAETLRLCFENKDARPWRTAEGDGLDFTLLREVAQRLDLQIDFQALPWKRCLAMLQANQVDGAFSVSYSPARARMAAFPGAARVDESKRMHIASYFLVRKKGSDLRWDGQHISNQQGPIGYQLGYSVGDFLRDQKVPTQELNMPAVDIIRKLLGRQLGGAAVFGSDVESLTKGPLSEQFEILQPPLVSKPYYLVLSHALVAARPQRAEQIWSAVEAARTSAEFTRLRFKGGGAD